MGMQLSPTGVQFIKGKETFRATVYSDVGHPAIGYGHDLLPGENFPNGITEPEGTALLLKDAAPIEAWLNRHFPTLSQGQFDALVSFGYNLGLGALATMLGHGLEKAPAQMPLWDHVEGKANDELYQRRLDEVQMFKGYAPGQAA